MKSYFSWHLFPASYSSKIIYLVEHFHNFKSNCKKFYFQSQNLFLLHLFYRCSCVSNLHSICSRLHPHTIKKLTKWQCYILQKTIGQKKMFYWLSSNWILLFSLNLISCTVLQTLEENCIKWFANETHRSLPPCFYSEGIYLNFHSITAQRVCYQTCPNVDWFSKGTKAELALTIQSWAQILCWCKISNSSTQNNWV